MDLRTVVSKSAPVLGAALSAINPLAGLVFSGIAHLFGVNTTDPQVLANAVANDPDHDVKLKQLELQHLDALKSAEVQLRQGAINREQAVIAATGKRDWIVDFLAIFTVCSFFVMALVVAFATLQIANHDIFYMLLGAFAGGWSVILNYYFGASMPKPTIPDPPKKSEIVLPPPEETGKG